jgi:serine/threonine protein kinase
MLDIAQTSNNLYLFLEYCNGGSLDQYLLKKKGKLSEKEALLIFEEFCAAFKNMQANKIIHRDIKPQNVLIHNSKIKIADFGFSKMVEDNDQVVMHTMLGRVLRQAPRCTCRSRSSRARSTPPSATSSRWA